MIRYQVNNIDYSLEELRLQFPNVSFPVNPTQDDLTPFGVVIIESVQPTPTIEEIRSGKLSTILAALAATDYKCYKFVDGDLSAEEYAETKTLRHNLRVAYNTVEAATTIEEIEAVTWEV